MDIPNEQEREIQRLRAQVERLESGDAPLPRDVSRRRRTEQVLRQTEEIYRALVQSSPDAIILFDPMGTFLEVSPRLLDIGGFDSVDELLGRNIFEFVAEEDREEAQRVLGEGLAVGSVMGRVFKLLRKDGSTFKGEVNATLYRDPSGETKGVVAVIRDVTEREAMDQALREREERLRLLVEILPHPVVILQKDRVAFASGASKKVFLVDPLEVVGRNPADFFGAAERKGLLDMQERRFAGETVPLHFFATLCRANGEEFPAEIFVQSLVFEGRSSAQYVIMDISERKRLEEQVRQSQKMEAIGTLAGGVAHDFNNLLTGILGCASILRKDLAGKADLLTNVEVIESAAERAADLTRQLLGFARKGKLRDVPVDLHKVVGECIALLSRTLDKNIRLTADLGAETSFVQGDPSQIQQVIMNLAVNARDAMPEGGELSLRTSVVLWDEETAYLHNDQKAGSYLLMEVADTGTGIPDEALDRIFEPFFTTKPPGMGTGMGLAVVYGIVNNHGGTVTVQTTEGQGTAFQVFLPALGSDPIESHGEATERLFYGTGHILVVDDEDLVLRATEKMLTSLGYEVVTARNGSEALDYCRVLGKEIDLVILDLNMPVLSGRDCFIALRAANPRVKVVVATGHDVDEAVENLLVRGARGFLRKPFMIGELSRVVAEAIG
jgi:PAS domain S-box-containing protein